MDGTALERADMVIADIRRLMAKAVRLIAESKLLIAQSQQLMDTNMRRVTSMSALMSERMTVPTLPGA